MKPIKIVTLLAAFFTIELGSAKASVTIPFDIGEITSGGNLIATGTFIFVSHGVDNNFNSSAWVSGTTFILGDDKFMGAFSISNGSATSQITNYEIPIGGTPAVSQGTYGTTKFTGIFINGLTSSDIDYSTGSLLNGKTFTAAGGSNPAYSFGTYRTDSIENYGNGPSGATAWILPSDGQALSLFAGSNTDLGGSGYYTGSDIPAALNTTSSFTIVPEPSTGALMMIGAAGLVALRRLRKV